MWHEDGFESYVLVMMALVTRLCLPEIRIVHFPNSDDFYSSWKRCDNADLASYVPLIIGRNIVAAPGGFQERKMLKGPNVVAL